MKAPLRNPAIALTLLTGSAFLWFDILWGVESSFRALSEIPLWLNLVSLSLLFSLPALLGRALKSQATIITLLSLLLECNILYFRTYFRAIPLTSYAIAGNLSDFMPAVWASLRWLDLGFAVITAAAWIIALRLRPRPLKPRHVLATLGATWLAAGIALACNGGFLAHWNSLGTKAHMHTARVPIYTVFGSLANDASQAASSLSAADRQAIMQRLERRVAPVEVASPRQSVVLVLCESLESWVVGLKIDGREVTPNLNALVADSASTFFAPNIVSQVGAGRSIDAQLIINAGLLPMDGRVYAMERAANHYFSLTKAVGGRSMTLSVDKPSTWNQEGVAAAFGIQKVIGRAEWINDEPIGTTNSLGDRSFMRQAVKRLAREWPVGDTAFVQLVTYAGHSPWRLPDSLDTMRHPTPELPEIGRYIAAAHYTDTALGLLLDYLRSRPDYHDMLIVITGDHEGLAAIRPRAVAAFPGMVSPNPLVPLIIANSPVAGTFNHFAGQIDIYPTLLDMLGQTSYPWRGLGTSLLSACHPHAAVGSDLSSYGNSDSTLTNDRRLSDLIITFNLLKP